MKKTERQRTAAWRVQSIPGIVVLAAVCGLAGCEPVALTLLGVGAGVGASHHMGGLTYRTFTEPLAKVKRANLAALGRMGIKVLGSEKTDIGEIIKARAADRSIEVELEALTPNTTRIKAVARRDGGIVMDAATAIEIINQTEKALGT